MIAGGAVRTVLLPCRLGDVSLFSCRLSVSVQSVDPFGPVLDMNAGVNLEELPPSVDGVLWRSAPLFSPLPCLQRTTTGLRFVPQQYRRFYVDLTMPFAAFMAGFSSKTRSTLKRKVRRVSDRSGGSIRWREYPGDGDMEDYCRLARVVSEKTYQERLLKLPPPCGRNAGRELDELARQGKIRGYLLLDRDQPVAFLQCPIEDGVVHYQSVGHDPAYNDWSPGTVLQYLVLERMFRDHDLHTFDFGEGEGAHKEFFATGSVRCADVYDLRPTLRIRSLARLHMTLDGLSTASGRMLDAIGLKRRLKKRLRTR